MTTDADVVAVYPLKFPIEIKNKGGDKTLEKITELTLRRPKGKHFKAIDRATGDVGKTFALCAAMASVPPEIFDEMDSVDIKALSEIVEPFF